MFRIFIAALVLVPVCLAIARKDAEADSPNRVRLPSIAADSASPGAMPGRTFAMGFTPFPYAVSQQAVDDVRAYLARDADLVVMHFDSGIPWQEALTADPFPARLQGEIDTAVRAAAPHHVRALQVTPIAFLRDGIAPSYEGSASPETWIGRPFDHPSVVAAYLGYVRRMIAATNPAYVNYGIEANLLFQHAPLQWDAYLRFLAAVYPPLKAEFPAVEFFVSIQVDAFPSDPLGQRSAVQQMLAYSDLVAVSTYPFASGGSVAAIDPGHFSDVAALDPTKPFAISETGWPAETLDAPYPAIVPSSPGDQDQYLRRVLADCDLLRCAFINWFLVRDYDILFSSLYGPDDAFAPIARIWRDIGFYAGDGAERPALGTWRGWLGRPRN
ncbi:MAG: hypothetical protein R3B97_10295 [Dehalococcoidia bacterium]|nr:hypothetical protein [Dehalococcoidia bacterium]MCA9831785.1 hypothetical protein [Dehalococcoidia bacterium]